jgi:hypothetical protein
MPDLRIDHTSSIRATSGQTVPRSQPTFRKDRWCAEPGCRTHLSIYNARERCWLHEPARSYHPKVGRTRNSDLRVPSPTVPPPVPSPDPDPVPEPQPQPPPSPLPTAPV